MIKDYVMDLSNSSEDDREPTPQRRIQDPLAPSHERSIRNVTVQRRTPPQHRGSMEDMRPDRPMPGKRRRNSRMIWIVAGIVVIAALVIGALLFLTSTSIDVTPRTHRVTFDDTTEFIAYPEGSAPAGAVSYTVETRTLEDSASVPAQGTERGEDRASGNITVFNDYSDKPVRLIKNTRFETPEGLIFRIPASVDVPGKTSSGPGQIIVTVIADGTGEDYNVGPFERLTVPGLKSTAEMYANVYARSTEKFGGGFVGERPVVTTQALESARAEIRNRLTEQAQALAKEGIDGAFVFPDLVKISFESLPTTSESSGNARISERATVMMPVMKAEGFAAAIASAVRADADENSVSLQPGDVFTARPKQELPESYGSEPISFSLSGTATLIWNLDTQMLKESLAGREQEAFEAIVSAFPGVDKAEAHIAPFWASAFPEDPSEIEVTVVTPTF